MRQFLGTLLGIWILAAAAAFVYAGRESIPRGILLVLLPAFLAEIAFYLVPGIEPARKAFDRLGPPPVRALLLTVSAVTPYLIESLGLKTFHLPAFLFLLGLAVVAAFWYAVIPRSTFSDLLFLVFMAAVFLSSAFRWIFPRPEPHLQIEILGKLMWIRLGILAVLSLRRLENIRFGFLPNSSEWRVGIQQFAFFVPLGAAAAYFLRFARFHPAPWAWWQFPLFAVGTFFGILWVTALVEEFMFRGFLLQMLSKKLRSETAAVIITSALFGAAHLKFHVFPNWRFAIVAAIAGVFYAIAFLRARSVRACMVTHALAVTLWRALFTG